MDRGEKRIVAISEDSFYRELDEKESLQAGRGMFNFDHPDAFDTDTMMRCLAGTLINAITTYFSRSLVTKFKFTSRDGAWSCAKA